MIIVPANTLAAGGFEVANSCRFNDGDSAYMHQTPSGNGSNTVFTLSLWFKRGQLGTGQSLFAAGTSGVTTLDILSGDTLAFYDGGSTTVFITNRVFRDVSAWYHIALICNTGESGTDQCKLYINGVLETSFSTDNRSSLDAVNHVNQTVQQSIGQSGTGSQYIDGYLAEIVMLDGTATAIGNLGEYDDDSPTIWKPIDVSGLSFGTNGYYLDFEDSSNLGNNAGSGAADFTEVNLAATDQTTDTPTNNFCVMNPLNMSSMGTLSEGNCLITGNSASNTGNVASTMAAKNGKWYAECKVGGKTGDYPRPGFQHTNGTNYGRQVNGTDGGAGGLTDSGAVYASDGDKFVSNTLSSFGASFANDNIINLAIDCDNGAAYVGVNNTWSNSGDPGSAGTKTGAILTWTPGAFETGFAATTYNSSFLNFNFGNPAYANSSDAADADGYGKFEYAPPTGYFALCTKNLAEYG